MYGKFSSKAENQSESLGSQQFFLRKVIVPPIRFRPESEGAFGGGGGDRMTDKAFLHTHSAMLMKVIQNNIYLSEALVELKKQDAVAKPGSSATQKWIQLQDSVNTFMDASMAGKTQDRT